MSQRSKYKCVSYRVSLPNSINKCLNALGIFTVFTNTYTTEKCPSTMKSLKTQHTSKGEDKREQSSTD